VTLFKLTYHRPGGDEVDLLVRADPGSTVGALADAVALRDPQASGSGMPMTLAQQVAGRAAVLPAEAPLDACGLRSGSVVTLLPAGAYPPDPALDRDVAVLRVVEGRDAGLSVPLRPGGTTIGRDPACDIQLTDPQVSKRHARIDVGSTVEIVDLNSTNGVLVGGGPVSRARLGPDDTAVLGDTRVAVTTQGTLTGSRLGAVVEFNRSPRLDPRHAGVEHEAPVPPRRPAVRRFPVVAMLIPLLAGIGLYWLTGSLFALVFVALSPLMVGGSYAEEAYSNRRAYRTDVAAFRQALASFNALLHAAADVEATRRRAEHPSTVELVEAAQRRTPLLWTRRPEHESFLELRLGLGRLPSRDTVVLPPRGETPADLWRELRDVVAPYAMVPDVPAVARLRECGALGIAEASRSRGVAYGIVAQLVVLHSPAELVLAAVTSATSAPFWDWLKWLPHTSSSTSMPRSPFGCAQLTAGGAASVALIGELDELVAQRSTAAGVDEAPLPAIVVLVEDDTDADRRRLVDLAERGPACGIHMIWVAPSVERLPAVCRTYLDVDAERAVAGFVREGAAVGPVTVERLGREAVPALGRSLAPVADAGARIDSTADLPRSVSFLALANAPVGGSPEAVLERWAESGSLPGCRWDGTRAPGLQALVGATGSGDPFALDLRTHGPHALVGGTTGAGKSELLQSWILGMATAYSPRRVTFLLVDYKGGAAFGACEKLPHTVGLVTDLTPHDVDRALASLHAELRRREKFLKDLGANDLGGVVEVPGEPPRLVVDVPGAPPRLVIVVDEFAALRMDVPEFVDGVIDVAQRGRSLGLHLILATQRPAGVITDSLRANTNLRIALRMADEGDSVDVLGVPLAAGFEPDIPGRAAVKTGPGRLVTFQTAFAGGRTTGEPAPPQLAIATLGFGPGEAWAEPERSGPSIHNGPSSTDIVRIVETVGSAMRRTGMDEPERPWLAPLPAYLELRTLLGKPAAGDAPIVFGLRDLPHAQDQPLAVFEADRDGNLVVFGTGGTGKSTLLRTVALSALQTDPGGVRVYGIEYGGRGLAMLTALPQAVVVRGERDDEVTSLLTMTLAEIERRVADHARVMVSSLSEYRRATGATGECRIILLVDGIGAFQQANPAGVGIGNAERLLQIATEGRSVGVHLVLSADRPGAVPTALLSALPRRVILRQAGDQDYAVLGIRPQSLPPDAPPGRGLFGGEEVQVAVLGGAEVAEQDAAVSALGRRWRDVAPAPAVRVLEPRIPLPTLDRSASGTPVFAVAKDTLEPVGLPPWGPFILTGPDGSGRTTALLTLVEAARMWQPGLPLYGFVSHPGTPLSGLDGWTDFAIGTDQVKELAGKLAGDRSPLLVGPALLVVESLPDLTFSDAEDALAVLLKGCTRGGPLAVLEGEVGAMSVGSRLNQLARVRRTGLVLQPQQINGQQLFQVDFPRLRQSDLIPGRGLYVRQGRPRVVQVAVPSKE